MVQWMQKHARVLTTPSTPEGQVAGPSLPEEVEQLHSAESAASDASYWPVSRPLTCACRTAFWRDAVDKRGVQNDDSLSGTAACHSAKTAASTAPHCL